MDQPTTGFSRRALARGTAWTVPVLAVSAAAPAFAISGRKVTETVTGVGITGQARIITIPKGAHDITYTVIGGGGGTLNNKNSSRPYDREAGSGSRLTGKLDVSSCSGSISVWMMGGGGGDQSGNPATGYGNGGRAMKKADPAFNVPYSASLAYGGGGGAGSAIMVGGAPGSGGTPIVVAGGGGGDGVLTNSNEKTSPSWVSEDPTGGKGGTPGSAGTALVTTYSPGSITVGAGANAVGASGGAGASSASTTIPAYTGASGLTGRAGGANGTGANRGGNGAEPMDQWREYTSRTYGIYYYVEVLSGAGGGGYAGGGSGATYTVDNLAMFPGNATSYPAYRYGIAGAAGAGGAGSDYSAATVGCVKNTQLTTGSANNAGSNTSGTGAGGPGSVTITYYV